MNLKMALATLGLSVMAASSALAQVTPSVTLVADPAAYNLPAAPGLVDITGTFTFTGASTAPDVFAVPNNFNLANGVGYNDPGPANGGFFPLISAGLVPLQLGFSASTGAFTSFNGPILSLAYDGTAQSTSGTVFYDIFDSDPTVNPNAANLGSVSTTFQLNIGGTPVPEPGTMALLAGGLIGGSVMLRRRRK